MSLGAFVLARLANAVALEPPEETLVWDAPPSVCPEPRDVQQRLVRLLGDEVSHVRVEARVQAQASQWRVDLALRWQGHHDVRTLVADRCETLADATVLLAASMADPLEARLHAPAALQGPQLEVSGVPSASAGDQVLVPPSEPAGLEPVASNEAADVEPMPAFDEGGPRARPRARGPFVGTSGLLDLGSLPRIGAGLAASVGWRWPRARLFVEAAYLPSQPVVSRAPYARQGRVQLGMARAGACVRLWLRAVELPLCGGAEVGGTRATGFGIRADLGVSDPWVAGFVDGGVVIPLMTSLALFGRVGTAVPLVYSEYVFADERLYRARAVALRGGLGLEFRWGQRNAGRPENPRGG